MADRKFAARVNKGSEVDVAIVCRYVEACHTIKEAAELLGISASCLAGWIENKAVISTAYNSSRPRLRREYHLEMAEKFKDQAEERVAFFRSEGEAIPKEAPGLEYNKLRERCSGQREAKRAARLHKQSASYHLKMVERTGTS